MVVRQGRGNKKQIWGARTGGSQKRKRKQAIKCGEQELVTLIKGKNNKEDKKK